MSFDQIEIHDQLLRITAPLTMDNAQAVVEAGHAALKGGDVTIDLSHLPGSDSSTLAVLFAWQRTQKTHGSTLRVVGASTGVRALASLYGVSELLVWA